MTYTLYTSAGNFRAFKALIAAEYSGVSVETSTDLSQILSQSPVGKAPVLTTSKGNVWESNAIARFIARVGRGDAYLTGGDMYEAACVDSWMDFAANEVELPACVWWYPVAGYMPFNAKAYEKAKTDLAAVLGKLECHLQTRTYLVGHQITLADIAVASALVYPMKLVCDKAYLKPFTNVTRWFTTCVNQPEFKKVIGEVKMCKTEACAPGQEKKKAEKAKKSGGGKKKKDKKADAPAPAPAKKKVEHPYKVMDKASPSPFSLDAWKKAYSNMEYDESMKYFWENFDAEGWSVWHQNYNYNEDNKRIFMTSNAVGGFQQRTDEVRKWAFGVMSVLGTEETVLEIKGMWLLRGDSTEHLINANDDANWYTWTKVAGKGLAPTDEVKEQVKEYWTSESEIEGKIIQDGKVFK